MVKAILIDDEADARFLMHKNLKTYFENEIKIVGEAVGCNAGIELIQSKKPDLVFLDIQMPDGSGFEVLSKFKNPDFETVFVTAYDRYALKAFEFAAMGYLVKPIDPQSLQTTVNRLLNNRGKSDMQIKVLIENHNLHQIKKIVVPLADGFEVVDLSQIMYINSDRNYSQFFLVDHSKLTSSKNLGQYESLLSEYGFFRIHQSHLVNLAYIKSFVRSDSSVVMKNNESLPVARNKKAEFVALFL
jgi:two-component system LytT family response regulator